MRNYTKNDSYGNITFTEKPGGRIVGSISSTFERLVGDRKLFILRDPFSIVNKYDSKKPHENVVLLSAK